MVESSPSSAPTPLARADVGAGAPEDAGSGRTMHVVALSSGLSPDWRWRIINYEGETVRESQQAFPTIAAAVAHGTQRLNEMDGANRAEVARAFRWNRGRR